MKNPHKDFKPVGTCPCGATTDLVWDHIDPSTKEFNVSSGISAGFSYDRIAAEVAKCRVLCRGCNTRRKSVHSEALIDEIRSSTERVGEIAARLGLNHSFVSRVRSGKIRSKRVVSA